LLFGDHARLQALLRAVDICEEGVQRRHALAGAGLDLPPFALGDDPRNNVKRDDPLIGLGLAIDGEGDPEPAKEQLRLGPACGEGLGGRFLQPFRHPRIERVGVGAGEAGHFVEGFHVVSPRGASLPSQGGGGKATANDCQASLTSR
jgi:hypothetical protein